jgi:hypothetical protein
LKGSKSIVAQEPSEAQIAAAKIEAAKSPAPRPKAASVPQPVITSKEFLARLTSQDQAAIAAEAIKQLAVGADQLHLWWAKVGAGHGIIILDQANNKAVEANLVANGVLTQALAGAAFAPGATGSGATGETGAHRGPTGATGHETAATGTTGATGAAETH